MHPGARSVTDIDAAEIIDVLSPLWRTMTVTAQRLRQRIGIVLKTATALYSLVPRQAIFFLPSASQVHPVPIAAMCGLWDDVDRTAGEFRLRDGKRGPRMVPLTTPALKVLDGIERVEGNPWVIRSQKPVICLPDLTYYWNRIKDHAGIEGVRIHDLRHSHASRALALGESLTMIGRILGHSKVGTTARYAHLVHYAEKAAAARTGDSIGAHLAAPDAEVA